MDCVFGWDDMDFDLLEFCEFSVFEFFFLCIVDIDEVSCDFGLVFVLKLLFVEWVFVSIVNVFWVVVGLIFWFFVLVCEVFVVFLEMVYGVFMG